MTLPIPTPYVWQVGDAITAGKLNAFSDAVNFMINPPLGQVIQATTPQLIGNNAWTAIQFADGGSGIQVDTYGGISSGTNTRYTSQLAGWYSVSGAVAFVANATGSRGGLIYRDGTVVKGSGSLVSAVGGGGITTVPVSADLVYLGVGQYVELRAYQNSGAALGTFIAGDHTSRLTVCWVHV